MRAKNGHNDIYSYNKDEKDRTLLQLQPRKKMYMNNS